jgi:hypothetical protein
LANARKRMITLTSTPYFRAASACEISCESSWSVAPTASRIWVEKRHDLCHEVRHRIGSGGVTSHLGLGGAVELQFWLGRGVRERRLRSCGWRVTS